MNRHVLLSKKDYYITSNNNLEESEKKSSFLEKTSTVDNSIKKLDITIKKILHKDLFSKIIEINPEKSIEILE